MGSPLVLLSRVKAATAAGSADQAFADIGAGVRANPMTVASGVLGAGALGAGYGLLGGGVAGAGYGTAKNRPIAGAIRGAGRGALTLGGAAAGGVAGLGGGLMANLGPGGAAAGGLLGAVLGGYGGWKGADKLMGEEMEEKRGSEADAFAGALQDMAATQLRSDAFRDVRNVGLTALGVGAAGRGIVGLIQAMKANKPKKTRSGPAYLPMPFPAAPEKVGGVVDKALAFLGGAAKRVGGAVGQGVKDVKLGLGVGDDARRLSSGRAVLQNQHRTMTQELRHAALVHGDTSGAVLPGGLADARMPNTAGPELKWLARHHATDVDGRYEALNDLMASQARGQKILGGAAAAGGAAGGYQLGKSAGFFGGDAATTKSGIPWYGPAMLLGGLGGLGVGWKGMDALIDARRKKEMEGELETARSQFHDALMSQYAKPVEIHPELMGKSKAAADATMAEVGRALDDLWEKTSAALAAEEAAPTTKAAFDLSNAAGQAAGGYGMYAALSGLLAGSLVYDKINKRSRRSVLDAALKKRQRRRFNQQPTEIYAQPEPVPVAGME